VNASPSVPYRRIGVILVERRLITPAQLARALDEQTKTGRPLGEICVERFGLDRLSLADALAEQWAEMQAATAAARPDPETPAMHAAGGDRASEPTTDDELRVLLEEAQAARAELTERTDELSKRLAALETLVVGVSDALAELRPSEPIPVPGAPRGRSRGRSRSKQARSSDTSATPRAASA
jgi:hypothetical protein